MPGLPDPVKYAIYGTAGAVLIAPIVSPAILGGIYDISSKGPVVGGAFAAMQAAGWVTAGTPLSTIHSTAMGGALPFVGHVGAGAIGALVGGGGKALVDYIHAQVNADKVKDAALDVAVRAVVAATEVSKTITEHWDEEKVKGMALDATAKTAFAAGEVSKAAQKAWNEWQGK